MSVIIEGMDIPSGCLDCRFFQGASGACIASHYQRIEIDDIHERPNDCPLRPLSNARPTLKDIAKMMKDDLETKEPCFWCKRKSREWDVIRNGSVFRCNDQDVGPYVPDELVNYCFHCGRKFK